VKKKQIRETLSLRLTPMALRYVKCRAKEQNRTQASVIEEAIAAMMVVQMRGEVVDAWTSLGLSIESSIAYFRQINEEKKCKKTS